ncbi:MULTISPECIES: hypothetical protein [unclassified Rhizobium]|jgi:hypothetical protein|uniref:hypothetical protein n=1 Tax=unclassified Rhizobium TaxID=2613769 RepID=UPI000DD8B957|nr:hypothetical protein [Rhizobium sp. UBA1881]
MQWLKFFLNEEAAEPPYGADPAGDPLSHPDLARMSLRELADLPLERCEQPSHSRDQPELALCA